jgi:hypothetical protein
MFPPPNPPPHPPLNTHTLYLPCHAVQILLTHVVPDVAAKSTALKNGQVLKTLNGQETLQVGQFLSNAGSAICSKAELPLQSLLSLLSLLALACSCLLVCSLARLLACSLARLLACSLARLLACSLARLLACSLARLLACMPDPLSRCSWPQVDLSTPKTVLIKPSGDGAAKVVRADIAACKAVIHIIDKVREDAAMNTKLWIFLPVPHAAWHDIFQGCMDGSAAMQKCFSQICVHAAHGHLLSPALLIFDLFSMSAVQVLLAKA